MGEPGGLGLCEGCSFGVQDAFGRTGSLVLGPDGSLPVDEDESGFMDNPVGMSDLALHVVDDHEKRVRDWDDEMKDPSSK